MSQKFETQGCQWYRVKRITSIFADKGIEEQGLEHVIITSSGFHFINKTDFEKHLFESNVCLFMVTNVIPKAQPTLCVTP